MSEQEIVDILKAGGCEVPTYKYRTTAGSTKNRAPRKKADSLVDSVPYQDQRKPETAVNNEPKLCFGTYTPPNPLDNLDRYIQGIIDCARLIKEWCGDG